MIFRSMELTIKTKNTDRTQEILQRIFRRKRLDAEVREIDPPHVGSIVYYVNLPLSLRTDAMSDRILQATRKSKRYNGRSRSRLAIFTSSHSAISDKR